LDNWKVAMKAHSWVGLKAVATVEMSAFEMVEMTVA